MEDEGEDPDFPFQRLMAGGLLEESNSNQGSPHDNGFVLFFELINRLADTSSKISGGE